MLVIFVDADACPVKDEVYRVSTRYGLQVFVVANSHIAVPAGLGAELVRVERGPDVADDWIIEHLEPGDIVVSGDIPLAARALAAGARVLGHDGRPFTEDQIGTAVAMRQLNQELRERGIGSRGPAPLAAKDLARFLSSLDQLVQAGLRDEAR